MTAGEPTGLRVEGLRHRHGARVLLDGVDLRIGPGESVAVTGPDGAATSALLHCLLGEETPAGLLTHGERRRTAVARALITGPDVLLADEPTAGLDPPDANAVAELLFSAVRERGCALLVVTRDPSVAARAGRTLRLAAGMLTHDTAGAGA